MFCASPSESCIHKKVYIRALRVGKIVYYPFSKIFGPTVILLLKRLKNLQTYRSRCRTEGNI